MRGSEHEIAGLETMPEFTQILRDTTWNDIADTDTSRSQDAADHRHGEKQHFEASTYIHDCRDEYKYSE